MRVDELLEHYVENLDLQRYIDDIEEKQESIDSMSIHFGNDPRQDQKKKDKLDKLDHEYKALEAMKMVLQKNKGRNTNLNQGGNHIFIYDVEGSNLVAAVWAKVEGDLVEVKWLGSIKPGHGRPLLITVLEKAKQMGARRAQLTSKWESEEFYKKQGFKPRTKSKMNIVGDMMGEYEKDLT